ncbi:mechanosensitive ion channel family protein [Anaerospora hongkongensis]|uniref:mechanosensitive ion channel family protein n=1 Tax=Anaerospora hongkongensis TaxID=244830 RepID=UPI0028A2AE4C|nr:mechanosensitive ion channel family protein [Anaerospora hongkongensis]
MLQAMLNQLFFQNSVYSYLTALLVFTVAVFTVKLFDRAVLNRLKIWAETATSKLDIYLFQTLEKTLLPALYFGSFYVAVRSLTLPALLNRSIDIIGIIIVTIAGIRFIITMVEYTLLFSIKSKDLNDREHIIKAIIPFLRIALWGIGLVFLLDNLGFQISTVIAGLGIGGIAVALAAQAMLRDLFSYVAIVFDRPFELGDFITIDGHMGTIEHIGIKTTRIRSLGGEQLIFSNSDLTNSRIQNLKRMETRRIVFKFRIHYQTSSQQLREIPLIVKQIIESIAETRFDRAHFSSLGESALQFDVVYYVLGSDYTLYMNIQQEINLKLKEALEERNIKFAYPAQTIYLEKPESYPGS